MLSTQRLFVPRVEQRHAERRKILDGARDQREVFGERGRRKEAIHNGQRNAASTALRHQVAPVLGNRVIDRQDPLGEACRQIVGEPGSQRGASRSAPPLTL